MGDGPRSHASLTVADLMTSQVIVLDERQSAHHADQQMDLADVRHLPVVDASGRLVGIVSNRDLLPALARGEGTTAMVGRLMSHVVETIAPAAPAREAARRMLDRKIGALPVVDAEGRIVGIITETDLLRFAHDALSRP